MTSRTRKSRAAAAEPPGSSLGAPSLQILDRGRPRSDRAFLRRVVRAALEHGGVPQMPVSLLLCDDAEISGIHGEFLGDRKPTDVISFALDGGAEIVVSVETAARQARARGHSVRAEVALYVVHGLLHLCGFDDRGARARVRMRKAERSVLHSLGIEIAAFD